jgi:hypothetical protein
VYNPTDKLGNPNNDLDDYVEIVLLDENQVRVTHRQFNINGKSVIISDEKFQIVESAFGERSEENATTLLIRSIFNLEPHKMIKKF